jgi:hypothetical protein
MKLRELKLLEAPLEDISYHYVGRESESERGARNSFEPREIRLLQKYIKDGTYTNKLKGIPFDLYVYVIDDGLLSDVGFHYPEGELPKSVVQGDDKVYTKGEWTRLDFSDKAIQSVFATIRGRLAKNPKSVHFIMGDNYAGESMNLTPWIVAHRFAHTLNFEGVDIAAVIDKRGPWKDEDLFKALAASLPMRSSRDQKIVDPTELTVEASTQVLVKGDIRVDDGKFAKLLKDANPNASDDLVQKMVDLWKEEVDKFKKRFQKNIEAVKGTVRYI